VICRTGCSPSAEVSFGHSEIQLGSRESPAWSSSLEHSTGVQRARLCAGRCASRPRRPGGNPHVSNSRTISALLVVASLVACVTAPKSVTSVSTTGATPIPLTPTAPATAGAENLTQVPAALSTQVPKRFSVFLGALEETGLAGRLEGKDAYTVFAPPNKVFNQMPQATRSALFQDRGRLTEVLEYHIVEGNYTPDVLPSVSTLPTLLGKSLTVTVGQAGALSVNGVAIHSTRLNTGNLILYSIDALLIPPG